MGSKKSRSGDEEGAAGGASGSKFDQSKPSGVTSAVLGRAVPVPVIVVHVGGRPATFGGNATHDNTGLEGVDGLLAAYRPGQEGAMAIARLLAGVTSPGGRLA